MYACITRETFAFHSFSVSVSFNFETQIMSTCMSTSRSKYIDMSTWKKHADHSTTHIWFLFGVRSGVRIPSTAQRKTIPTKLTHIWFLFGVSCGVLIHRLLRYEKHF